MVKKILMYFGFGVGGILYFIISTIMKLLFWGCAIAIGMYLFSKFGIVAID